MPWYYAGPEAKPVGPVSAEELQALRATGTITPETFVIEHIGASAANLAWKRYREVFPAMPVLPQLPVTATPPAAATVPATPHPLFPSAAHVPAPYAPTAAPSAYPHIRPTNGPCAWGFGLSLIGVCFALCGIGAIPALIGAILCIVGLVQVSRSPGQRGQGLAIGGLIISGVALLVAIGMIAWMSGNLHMRGITVTEQTSNDSE